MTTKSDFGARRGTTKTEALYRRHLFDSPTSIEDWDAWVWALIKSHHPYALYGIAVAMHLNLQSGQCNPGQGVLAAKMGRGRRTIERAIAELVKDGWLNRQRRGMGRANGYALAIPKVIRQLVAVPTRHLVADQDPPPGGRSIRTGNKNKEEEQSRFAVRIPLLVQ